MPGQAAVTCEAAGRDLPDRSRRTGAPDVQGASARSILLSAEQFAALRSSVLIECGRGMRGIRTARAMLARLTFISGPGFRMIRRQERRGMEYAVAKIETLERVTGRKIG